MADPTASVRWLFSRSSTVHRISLSFVLIRRLTPGSQLQIPDADFVRANSPVPSPPSSRFFPWCPILTISSAFIPPHLHTGFPSDLSLLFPPRNRNPPRSRRPRNARNHRQRNGRWNAGTAAYSACDSSSDFNWCHPPGCGESRAL